MKYFTRQHSIQSLYSFIVFVHNLLNCIELAPIATLGVVLCVCGGEWKIVDSTGRLGCSKVLFPLVYFILVRIPFHNSHRDLPVTQLLSLATNKKKSKTNETHTKKERFGSSPNRLYFILIVFIDTIETKETLYPFISSVTQVTYLI